MLPFISKCYKAMPRFRLGESVLVEAAAERASSSTQAQEHVPRAIISLF